MVQNAKMTEIPAAKTGKRSVGAAKRVMLSTARHGLTAAASSCAESVPEAIGKVNAVPKSPDARHSPSASQTTSRSAVIETAWKVCSRQNAISVPSVPQRRTVENVIARH